VRHNLDATARRSEVNARVVVNEFSRNSQSKHNLEGTRACCSRWSAQNHQQKHRESQACPSQARSQCRCGSSGPLHTFCCTCSRDRNHLGKGRSTHGCCNPLSVLHMLRAHILSLHSERVCQSRTRMSSCHHHIQRNNATRLTTCQNNGQGMHHHCKLRCGSNRHSVGIQRHHKQQGG
jgi:hypothetical protein